MVDPNPAIKVGILEMDKNRAQVYSFIMIRNLNIKAQIS